MNQWTEKSDWIVDALVAESNIANENLNLI